jgi:hypothetical protein
MKTNPVYNFILGQKKNFQIAASVSEAWRDTRQQVLLGFLDRLDTRLIKTLKGWKSEREKIFYEDPWASFNFWKPTWDNQYGLGLMWDDTRKEMIFGVYREDNIWKRPHCDELLNTIASKIQLSVKKNPWWEARIRMKSPASDWSTPEILWRMHSETKFLDEVAEQLLDVARIATPIVDRLARKK